MTLPLEPVTAIVVTYRTGRPLVDCLYALKGDPDISAIILVDNGNPPKMEAWIDAFMAATPKAKLIRRGTNPGFGAAVNCGAAEAGAGFLLVLNPDAILRSGSIRPLIDALVDRPSPAIAGGRLFDIRGREERGSRRATLTLARAIGIGRWTLDHEPAPSGPVPVGAISGGFFLMRREDFQALEGFDEDYFLHVEDVDLCRRAIAAGGAVIYQPQAGALHYRSSSDVPSPVVQGHKAASLARYFRKFARGPAERRLAELAIPFITLALRLRQ